MKEVATKTNDVAGDGTTTATVLAQAIVREGLKNVAAGANPMFLKRGIEKAVETCVKRIEEVAKPVETKEAIAQVASIAAADPEIGALISDAMEKVGKDGVITVEESNTIGTTLEVVEGMQFDRGYISHYMVTDTDRMEAVLEEPRILITDRKISAVADILPILEKIIQINKPLVIIAEDVEGEALGTLIVNKLRGTCRWSPSRLRASAIGARPCSATSLLSPADRLFRRPRPQAENVTLDMLGQARQVRVTKEDTTIVDGKGSPEAIKARSTRSATRSRKPLPITTVKLQERLAKLSGGVAVIRSAQPPRQS